MKGGRRRPWLRPLLLLVLSLHALQGSAGGLGRLLTSPEERQFIDRHLAGSPGEETQPDLLQFEGAMVTDGGRLAFWINGRRYEGAEALEPLGLVLVEGPAGPVMLAALDREGRVRHLMPGQVLDRATGQVRDLWNAEQAASDRRPEEGAEGAAAVTGGRGPAGGDPS